MLLIVYENKELYLIIFIKNYKVNYIKKEKKWLILFKKLIMPIKIEIKQIIKYKHLNNKLKNKLHSFKNKLNK
jgi:hypothetical protein